MENVMMVHDVRHPAEFWVPMEVAGRLKELSGEAVKLYVWLRCVAETGQNAPVSPEDAIGGTGLDAKQFATASDELIEAGLMQVRPEKPGVEAAVWVA